MHKLSLPGFLWLGVFLFFTTVQADNSCFNLFVHYRTALVTELEHNQRLDWIEYSTDVNGSSRLWTLSYSDNGQFFSMFQIVDAQNRVVGVSLKPVDYSIERSFYIQAGKYFEAEMDFFKIPGFGKRFVHVSEYTKVKLLVKHGLTVEYLFHVLKTFPGQQDKQFMPTSIQKKYHAEGVPYTYFITENGFKRRLVIVFEKNAEDPEVVDVLTAYFYDNPEGT